MAFEIKKLERCQRPKPWNRWEYSCFHSSYGGGWGYAPTKRLAEKRLIEMEDSILERGGHVIYR